MSTIIDLNNIALTIQSLINIPIFDGRPNEEPIVDLYAWTRIVDDSLFNRWSWTKVSIVEFTFVWVPTLNRQIRDKIQELSNLLTDRQCTKIQEYGNFIAWNVSEWSTRWPWYTEKNKVVYTKQFSFSFAR